MSEARRDLNEVIMEEDQEKIIALEEKFKNVKENMKKQEISTPRKEEMFKKAKELLNKEMEIIKKSKKKKTEDSREEMDKWFQKLEYATEAEGRLTAIRTNEQLRQYQTC